MPATAEPPPAPPAAAPPPPAAAPTERPAQEWMGDISNDFAEMDAGRPAPERPRDEKGKFQPVEKRPVAKAPEKPAEKPPEKPVEEVKPDDKAAGKPAEEPVTEKTPMRTLGERYEGLKRQVEREYKPKIQSLESKLKEFESSKVEDPTPLLKKVKDYETENQELKKRLALTDYSEEPEYRQTVEKFNNEWYRAVSEFQQLRVRMPDGEDELGNPKFKVRPATDQDLLELANMSLSDMDERANAMFGASAPRVINRLENIRSLSEQKAVAEKRAKDNILNVRTERETQAKAHHQQVTQTWAEVNKALQERFPKAFSPEQGDAEDAASHSKGFALADLMFVGPQGLTPEQIESLPDDFKSTVKAGKPLNAIQTVRLHAIARLKMANHDRQVAARKKLTARVAELEKTLAEYEKSEPSSGKAGESHGEVSLDPMSTIEQELRAMDR